MSDINHKFVYVFDKNVRDALVVAGFDLLVDKPEASTFVFLNGCDIEKHVGDCTCFYSDTMVF